ncbi:helix-turn-helix domain-containing protein [Nocardia sp. 2YAB30]|uniref:helix-turn-helix domain-containing protein n=1 Tax=Nocardia sp. 2YAB30 TaxID=3233022 RepID=UPI003F9CDC38
MDNHAEVRDFLRSRRARIAPEDAGVGLDAGQRRVPGLRREEVALLAGISVEYYVRMERGKLHGVSAEVLDSVCAALQFDEAEIEYLHNLASAQHAHPHSMRDRVADRSLVVRPSLRRLLDSITGAPTWIRNQRIDFIATNPIGQLVFAPMLADPAHGSNCVRFLYLDPAAREYFPDWEDSADNMVATLRAAAAQNPRDAELTDLIDELHQRSDDFRIRWAAHNVRFHRTGTKRIRHPEIGDLELLNEAMELPGSPGWTMYAFTCEPGSATAHRLHELERMRPARADHSQPSAVPTA